MVEQIERILHNLEEKICYEKRVKTTNFSYHHMDISDEKRHVSPNASHGNYIVVHTGSIYRERTVAVRSDLKYIYINSEEKDRHCCDSSVAYVVD